MTNPSTPPKVTTKKHIARLERERRQVALIRTIAAISIGFVILLIGYGALDSTYLRLRKPVAEVNGEVINLKYWQERVQWQRSQLIRTLQMYQFYQQNFGLDTSQQQQQIQLQLQYSDLLGDQVLSQLVDEALIRQEAQKRGITVSPEEIEELLQENLSYFPNGTPTPTITPTEFSYPTLTTEQLALYPPTSTPTPFLSPTPGPTDTPDPAATVPPTASPTSSVPTPTFIPAPPTATSTPYTFEGYQKSYKELVDSFDLFGVSESTFRSVFENQLYREKLMEEIAKDTPHTAEQVWARHILLNDYTRALAVQALLRNGSDFAKLAREYSEDTGSGLNGGDLGWFGRGQMVTEFEQAAFTQEIGAIGELVQTQFGYHIIQVIAREELPVSASQYEQLKQTAFTDWLTKVKEDATAAGAITRYDETWQNNIPAMPSSMLQ
jgi:parvulin-like peptidyl-prolyl isomerase